MSTRPTAENVARPHGHHDHDWWECEECREWVSDTLDARLRKKLIADGIPERDADLLIAQSREEGRRLRETRVIPPGSGDTTEES